MPPLTPEHQAERLRRPIPPLLSDEPLDPEIYRQIYAGLDLPSTATVTLLGVASAVRGEGRSTIALGLATTLAADLDVHVTLVEADLERPRFAEMLHAAPSPGLAAVLREEHQPQEVVCEIPTRFGSLSLISAGRVGQNARPLLRRLAEHDPFRGPQGLEGLVILDLPPLVSSSLGALAARLADATVLVVRAGVTPHRLVREAIARLGDRPPQGVVLNAFSSAIPRWWPTWNW
jgi:receptor protein-tyrosine kinase